MIITARWSEEQLCSSEPRTRFSARTIRTGNGPQVMATLRSLVIAILKLASAENIAACRHHTRDAPRTLATLGLSPQCQARA